MNYSLNVKSSSIVHTLLSNCVKLLGKSVYKQCKHYHIFLIFLLGLVGETPFINSPTAHLFIPPLMQSAQISKQTFKYQSQKS